MTEIFPGIPDRHFIEVWTRSDANLEKGEGDRMDADNLAFSRRVLEMRGYILTDENVWVKPNDVSILEARLSTLDIEQFVELFNGLETLVSEVFVEGIAPGVSFGEMETWVKREAYRRLKRGEQLNLDPLSSVIGRSGNPLLVEDVLNSDES